MRTRSAGAGGGGTAGRALRLQPGEGKIASLVVPVLLGPGETADNMLTSRAFGGRGRR
ncbi:hypothetical protein [Streptomyces lydicus]|uniref:hypothetical protein n=1 Tax=Streptomyces lydicus TaxID=47763 RepID=UPI003798C422